jgi:hypothetical protein
VERVVILNNGSVVGVGSNLAQDRLGHYLLRQGRVDEATLDGAQRYAAASKKRIGQILIERKLLEQHDLWSAIQEQITDLFSDSVQWTSGAFVLMRLPKTYEYPSTPPFPMTALLMEAVRRTDEMSVYKERISSMNTRLRRTGRVPPAEFEAAALHALSLIQHECSVLELSRAMRTSDFEAIRLSYGLLKAGVVEVSRGQTGGVFVLSEGDRQRIDVFNVGLREIHDEANRAGRRAQFIDGVHKFIANPESPLAPYFAGIAIDENGAVSASSLLPSLARAAKDSLDASHMLGELLHELTFFMLFHCGTLVDSSTDEHLSRRIQLIHQSLGQRS